MTPFACHVNRVSAFTNHVRLLAVTIHMHSRGTTDAMSSSDIWMFRVEIPRMSVQAQLLSVARHCNVLMVIGTSITSPPHHVGEHGMAREDQDGRFITWRNPAKGAG
nr:hypothetical protein CFP56_22319 [Quercus suber]